MIINYKIVQSMFEFCVIFFSVFFCVLVLKKKTRRVVFSERIPNLPISLAYRPSFWTTFARNDIYVDLTNHLIILISVDRWIFLRW